ncbi:MAG: DUF488 domain-containing protein [Deltaproteobacteria bacterium]|nr:DUF488 domain-containing protein [Deltaproteobacteria bacterium]MBW2152358.1 DUF488 domain-containing protein [Deltaproteobacteria bacterium]
MHLYTIGHSNRSFEEFLAILSDHNIKTVVDVRRFPSSRKFPHFNSDNLQKLLDTNFIHYRWFESLGGYRRTLVRANFQNAGLQSPGFRNYADYMSTNQFKTAAGELLLLSKQATTVIMCAEKFFWKCHRMLLSDFLTAQGIEVIHILDREKIQPHKLSAAAKITENKTVIYPSNQ